MNDQASVAQSKSAYEILVEACMLKEKIERIIDSEPSDIEEWRCKLGVIDWIINIYKKKYRGRKK